MDQTNDCKVRIGTHDGMFHCDEVLAVALLKMLPEFKDAEVVRSRDKTVLKDCTIVVDVGGVYDHSKLLYDHHMRDFSYSLNSLNPSLAFKTKLSSAGLIYYHYGHELLSVITGQPKDSNTVHLLYGMIYKHFVEAIDGIDNGIATSDGVPRYHIASDLSSRVKRLNPHWNEREVNELSRFEESMALAGKEFVDTVMYFMNAWIPARDHVVRDVDNRFEVHPSGEIIRLSNGHCPFLEHLFDIEESQNITPLIKYVLIKNTDQDYRVRSVPLAPESFELRCPLPEKWRGLRDQDLCDESQVNDAVFVHSTGFIGGTRTYEASLKMAERALALSKNAQN